VNKRVWKWMVTFGAAGLLLILVGVVGGGDLRRSLSVLRHGERDIVPVKSRDLRQDATSVLLLVLDTTRRDALSPYRPSARTPHIAALGQKSVIFDACTAAASFSGPSYASLFTGLYAARHGVFDHPWELPRECVTLFEAARQHGLYTVYMTQHPYLRRRWHYDQGADLYRYGPDDEYLTDELVKWLEENPLVPFVGFLALTTPHWPYDVAVGRKGVLSRLSPSDGKLHRETSDATKMFGLAEAGFSDEYLPVQRDLYAEEVQRADALVGRVLSALERTGRLGKTVVVLTADHGEAFGEHGFHFAHDPEVHAPVSRVPLLVSFPQRYPSRHVPDPVGLVDLFPTVMEWIGAPCSPVDGRSLVPLLEGREDRSRTVFCFSRGLLEDRVKFPLVRDRYRFLGLEGSSLLGARGELDVVLQPMTEGFAVEVYERAEDPLHLVDLAGVLGDDPRVEGLVAAIQEYRSELLDRAPHRGLADLSQEQRKALSALGYLDPD